LGLGSKAELIGQLGIPTKKHHHEVAGAGKHELGMKFAELIEAADNVASVQRQRQR